MADMTLNEVREGLALAIEQKNAEGIQLFTNIYSAMEARKNKKTPMENFIRSYSKVCSRALWASI